MAATAPGANPTLQRPLVVLGAVAGALVAVALALWAQYGSTVFYEMILSGIAACL